MKSKVKLNSMYGLFAIKSTHKDREIHVKYITEEDKNKILQCAIDFGYVDTDNVKQLIINQTLITYIVREPYFRVYSNFSVENLRQIIQKF